MSEPEGKFTRQIEQVLNLVCAVPLFFIVLLTFSDVFARYLFAAPIKGSVEMVEYAMALVIFIGLPLVTWRREHVTVGLLDNLVPKSGQRYKQILCDTISLVALGLLTWRLFVQASEQAREDMRTIVLGWPHAQLTFALATLSLVAALAIAMHIFQTARVGHGAAQ